MPFQLHMLRMRTETEAGIPTIVQSQETETESDNARQNNFNITEKPAHTSRSEKAPGSGFHPRDKSTKVGYGFCGPCWCNTNLILKDKFHTDHIKNL